MEKIKNFFIENKDWISNIFGIILFLYEPLNSYLTEQPFNITTFLMLIYGAIVSYTIGKKNVVK